MRTPRQINDVFEKIINSNMPPRVKGVKLRGLLREMERSFNMANNEDVEVKAIYQKIQDSITK
ncbi:hypothetical protein WQ57_14930 [Mesobacillus campisalis]|uniref:Uncharacterized protein n=1 Tax=Mesobacillus campisalis TaxID=1408103 RepID=A0A0M2SSY7_9BACI|nr:hypothetical protein WQ57_14930 [Mesobacillus campisalis]